MPHALQVYSQAAYYIIYGEYEWNDKGGVIHWTHRDPQGKHPDGWLRHNNTTYQ